MAHSTPKDVRLRWHDKSNSTIFLSPKSTRSIKIVMRYSMTLIHKTALVDPKAQLGEGVRVGAYSIVGSQVILEDQVCVLEHAIIQGQTRIEKWCEIFPFVSIGLASQDKKSPKGTQSKVHIGHHSVIREHTSIHGATLEADTTYIGNNCLIMGQAHIAHDCRIGNYAIISQGTVLGGHVFIDDYATIGGVSAIHQFVRVGKYAMLGAKSILLKDLLPFFLTTHSPATLHRINYTGLLRNGFTLEDVKQIEYLSQIILDQRLTPNQIQEKLACQPHFASLEFLNFIKQSTRGLVKPKKLRTESKRTLQASQPPVFEFTNVISPSSNASLE
jgi:UDP-N-acetylglucosamine acyltransferase